jgi:predicted membrane-bound spermidine synthase
MSVFAGTLAMFVFFRGSTSSKIMFLTGFSATGLEILLLFGLQIFFGNIYLLTSFVFSGFMLGLATGSFFGKSFKTFYDKKYLPITQLLIGVFAGSLGILLFSPEMAELPQSVVYSLYLAATVMIGGLTGFQFTQASISRTGSYAEISGKTYSYDLFGSALGALAVTLFLIPKFGIVASVLTISFVNLVFGFWLFLKKK